MTEEILRKLGLSPYESKCYMALVSHGNLGGKEIAKLSSVPPTSVYKNLESLKEKRLVVILQKDPMVYHAIEPSVALKEFIEKGNLERCQLVEKCCQDLENLKKEQPVKSAEKVFSVLIGKNQSYKVGINIVASAKKEMLVIGRGERPGIFELSKQLIHSVKKGVDVRFITTGYEDNLEVYKKLKSVGIKIKKMNSDMTLLIKDGEEAQIVTKKHGTKEERFALHVVDSSLAKALREYYLSLWKRAQLV